MKKLFNFKKWLTLSESAKRLTSIFEEDVSEADVLRLGLDGHLILSVNFINNTKARLGKIVDLFDTKWTISRKAEGLSSNERPRFTLKDFDEIPKDAAEKIQLIPIAEQENYDVFMTSLILDLDMKKFINLDDNVVSINGIWDLPMIGAELLHIEDLYQKDTGGPKVKFTKNQGLFLKRGSDEICLLQEVVYSDDELVDFEAILNLWALKTPTSRMSNLVTKQEFTDETKHTEFSMNQNKDQNLKDCYNQTGRMSDDDFVVVIRSDELINFEQRVREDEQLHEKPLESKERNTLLTLISAILNYSAVDVTSRNATSKIVMMTEDLGAPISDDTIRSILNKLPYAVDSRMR